MSKLIIIGVLSANVAAGGTVALAYPNTQYGFPANAGYFTGGVGHKAVINQGVLSAPKDFSIAPGASTIVVTNNTTSAWAAGSSYTFELHTPGVDDFFSPSGNVRLQNTTLAPILQVTLGSPVAASSTLIAASQAVTGGVAAVLTNVNGVTLDAPRNVVAAWTTTSVATVRGFDFMGRPMTEVSASGTSFTGKKAFKRVTGITFSVSVTGMTAGSGVILGLPVFLPNTGAIIKEVQDGATATAGVTVAGIQTAGGSTGTTGDVLGTYSPNSAPDGSRSYQLYLALTDPGYLGTPQFAG